MPSLEEAKRCPKCQEPGEATAMTPGTDSLGLPCTIHTYKCQNPRCNWFEGSGWIVQVRADGTIPEREMKGKKQYEQMSSGAESMARRQMEQLAHEDPAIAEEVKRRLK